MNVLIFVDINLWMYAAYYKNWDWCSQTNFLGNKANFFLKKESCSVLISGGYRINLRLSQNLDIRAIVFELTKSNGTIGWLVMGRRDT